MIDGSEKRKRQLPFELELRVFVKSAVTPWLSLQNIWLTKISNFYAKSTTVKPVYN